MADPRSRRRRRVLVEHDGDVRSFIWVDQEKADIYLGPFDPDVSDVEVATRTYRADVPTLSPKYTDLQSFKNYVSPKVSFHPRQHGLSAQIHLRGFAEGTEKTKPLILSDRELQLDKHPLVGCVIAPELSVLPRFDMAKFDTARDHVLPIAYASARPPGFRLHLAPPSGPIILHQIETVSVIASFSSPYCQLAVVVDQRDSYAAAAPFLTLALTSLSGPPFEAEAIGFRPRGITGLS